MEKYITIDHRYSRITLCMENVTPPPLNGADWRALNNAERALYVGDSQGSHGWTDIMPNDGDALLNHIWQHTWMQVEGTTEIEHDGSVLRCELDRLDAIRRETATRVAAVLAVASFGKDILLR